MIYQITNLSASHLSYLTSRFSDLKSIISLLPCRIKLPVLIIFEEVNLVVSTPDKSRVNIIRNTWKPILDALWITWRGLHIDELPVEAAFEDVGGLGVLPGESCLDVVGQSRPVR